MTKPARRWMIAASLFAAVGLWQCSQAEGSKDQSDTYAEENPVNSPEPVSPDPDDPDPDNPDPSPGRDVDEIGTAYRDHGADYGCTQDCSGHEAGWAWAEENGITEPDDCGGYSLSFEEGCRAYAEQSGGAERWERW